MKFYTTKEISCILGLSIKTVQKLVRERQLPAFRVGGRYLVSEDTLKEYISARKVQTTQKVAILFIIALESEILILGVVLNERKNWV